LRAATGRANMRNGVRPCMYEIIVNRSLAFLALSLAGIASATSALGHHSTSMFEAEKRVSLTGNIKEFQWTNPHAWIQMTVTAPDGTTTDWSFECGSPNTLSRQGWKPSTLKPGDEVTVVANPMKDGTSAGLMYTVALADGRTLGPGAPAQSSASPATSR
jgi:hypothetical protein